MHIKTKEGYQLAKPSKDNIGLYQLHNLFTDYLKNSQYTFTAFGSSTATIIKGDYYFQSRPLSHTNSQSVATKPRQKVKTKYVIHYFYYNKLSSKFYLHLFSLF